MKTSNSYNFKLQPRSSCLNGSLLNVKEREHSVGDLGAPIKSQKKQKAQATLESLTNS